MVLFLLAIVGLPILVAGPAFMQSSLSALWPLVLVLLVIAAGLNIFFLLNRRLFMLLEREDWPALVDYLERRVLDTGRYSPRLVKLLANSYLIMSDSAGVLRLEKKLALEKPALVEQNALVFGAARILGGDSAGAAEFFNARVAGTRPTDTRPAAQWLRWYYGFSLLLARAFEKAADVFSGLAAASTDAIITGLSAWFLSDSLAKHSQKRDECRALAEQGRERVARSLKRIGEWKKEAAKIENDIHAAIIKKYIDEAAIWLFSGE